VAAGRQWRRGRRNQLMTYQISMAVSVAAGGNQSAVWRDRRMAAGGCISSGSQLQRNGVCGGGVSALMAGVSMQ